MEHQRENEKDIAAAPLRAD